MRDIVERLLDEVIDTTFLKRGFQAQTHREAILAALDGAGYAIVPKPADEISRLFKEAEVEEMRAALALFYRAPCPLCGGDCSSATPPVFDCPMRVARRALEGRK